MKAFVYHKYGSPSNLYFTEVPLPDIGNDDVLIKVHAASINSWDWDLLRGTTFARIDGIWKPGYKILGADIAGRVEKTGRDVRTLQKGDEVFGDISGCNWGGFADYACARETALVLKPADMSFEEAAAMPQAGVLALQGLRDTGSIQSGQSILINGAGGGMGTFAVQIAKSYGTEVTAVDRTEKLDVLRSIGADKVIDYTRENYTRSGHQYDLILDAVAKHSILAYRKVLRPGGAFVMVGGSVSTLLQFLLLGSLMSKSWKKKLGILAHKPAVNDLEVLKKLTEDGNLRPIIDRQYPLHELAEAFHYFGTGMVKGKVVITMKENR